MTTDLYAAAQRRTLGIKGGIFAPSIGQSGSLNGNQNGPASPAEQIPPLPGRVLTFPVGVRCLPNSMGDQTLAGVKVQDADLGPFIDGAEKTTAGSGTTGMIEFARQLYEWFRKDGVPECIVPMACGIGEGQYASTKFGTVPCTNMEAGGIAAARNFASLYLAFRMPVILAPDTEGNAWDGRVSAAARIAEQYADLSALMARCDGLDIPRFVVKDQSSGWANQGVVPSITQAVLGVLDALTPDPLDGGIAVMGPRYQCLSYQDAAHLSEYGSKLHGAYMARTVYRLLKGEDARPLYPTSCRWERGGRFGEGAFGTPREGTSHLGVVCDFPMARGGLRLSPVVTDPGTWGIATDNDEHSMPGVAKYGFTADKMGVYVTHAAPTTGTNRRLSIAMQAGPGIGATSGPRSSICDNDVDAFGVSMPNHCCHFASLISDAA